MSRRKMIIALMPTRGTIFTKAEVALEQEMLDNSQLPYILRTDNMPIPDCRNVLVENGLKTTATHFLLMDDDVIMPVGGLKKLIEANTDIAFIDYPMHYEGERWGNMGTATYDEWLPGDSTDGKPIAWAGLGCVLVKREVFEKLPKPWFKTLDKKMTRDENGKLDLQGTDVKIGAGGGEDVYFFLEARKAGFEIKQVKGTCGHARFLRLVGAFNSDKYYTQHKIIINNNVEKPYR
jgi:hypothetical protein